jgi:hypothetical protein
LLARLAGKYEVLVRANGCGNYSTLLPALLIVAQRDGDGLAAPQPAPGCWVFSRNNESCSNPDNIRTMHKTYFRRRR